MRDPSSEEVLKQLERIAASYIWVHRFGQAREVDAPAASGSTRLLCAECEVPHSWSPDDRFILWSSSSRLASFDLNRGASLQLFSSGKLDPYFSPDGKWLSLTASAPDSHEVRGWIVPFRAHSLHGSRGFQSRPRSTGSRWPDLIPTTPSTI